MNIRTINAEVYQAEGTIVWAAKENVEFLKARALENPRGRARLCAHPGPEDRTHEMLVALRRDILLRPHVHPGNIESFTCVDGAMRVFLFNEDGSVLKALSMGPPQSGKVFFYRHTRPTFHTLIVESDVAVFLEVTQGPFNRESTVLAPWAPSEDDRDKLRDYLAALAARTGAEG